MQQSGNETDTDYLESTRILGKKSRNLSTNFHVNGSAAYNKISTKVDYSRSQHSKAVVLLRNQNKSFIYALWIVILRIKTTKNNISATCYNSSGPKKQEPEATESKSRWPNRYDLFTRVYRILSRRVTTKVIICWFRRPFVTSYGKYVTQHKPIRHVHNNDQKACAKYFAF